MSRVRLHGDGLSSPEISQVRLQDGGVYAFPRPRVTNVERSKLWWRLASAEEWLASEAKPLGVRC
jgi:hypothetical protein